MTSQLSSVATTSNEVLFCWDHVKFTKHSTKKGRFNTKKAGKVPCIKNLSNYYPGLMLINFNSQMVRNTYHFITESTKRWIGLPCICWYHAVTNRYIEVEFEDKMRPYNCVQMSIQCYVSTYILTRGNSNVENKTSNSNSMYGTFSDRCLWSFDNPNPTT